MLNVRRPVQLAPRAKPRELQVLAISDIRSQSLDDLVSHVRRLQTPPDLILYAGDDVARFRHTAANYFEALAALARYGLFGVIGNDDGPEARAFVSGQRVYEVHSRPVRVGDVLIVGLEGAPLRKDIAPIGSPLYREAAIAKHLAAATAHHGGPILVCSHPPPFRVLDHAMRFGDAHIGSRALRDLIRRDPRIQLVVCGHCHRGGVRPPNSTGPLSSMRQAMTAPTI